MAAGYASRRDGSFVVELFTPLKHMGQDIDAVIVRAPSFQHSIRWNRREIPSALALLGELTGLPERLLREIQGPDVERVTFALFNQAGFAQKDVFEGKWPFATPEDEMPTQQQQPVSDQTDPRFPKVDGPVKRYVAPPKVVIPDETKTDMNLDFGPPEVAKAATS